MLRRRIEKLDAWMPLLPARLMESLDQRAFLSLSQSDCKLVDEVYGTIHRRKLLTPEHHSEIERFQQSYAILLQDGSDEDLAEMVAIAEREHGQPIQDFGVNA